MAGRALRSTRNPAGRSAASQPQSGGGRRAVAPSVMTKNHNCLCLHEATGIPRSRLRPHSRSVICAFPSPASRVPSATPPARGSRVRPRTTDGWIQSNNPRGSISFGFEISSLPVFILARLWRCTASASLLCFT